MRWLPPAPQVGFCECGAEADARGDGGAGLRTRGLLWWRNVRSWLMGRVWWSRDFEVVAVNSPESPTVYRANMKFEEAGNWVLHIQIDSPTAGRADFRAPIVTLPPPIEPGLEGGWVLLGIVIALTAGSVYLVISSRRARAAREGGL